jgi:hypothetical protein
MGIRAAPARPPLAVSGNPHSPGANGKNLPV